MIKLDIMQHRKAWANFGSAVKEIYHAPSLDEVNTMLAPCNGKMTVDNEYVLKYDITFDTEQDLTLFLLRWS